MQRAKALLRNDQITITAVATQVGYQSDIAFAAAGFLLLTLFRMPPLFVVLALAAIPFATFAGF